MRRALSLEPADVKSASWPKTFGIWVYALIAEAPFESVLAMIPQEGNTSDTGRRP